MSIGAGEEQHVNTVTADWQSDPSITKLADGGWMVTWMSYEDELPSPQETYVDYGIWQQRYDINGNAVGSATHVNFTYANGEALPEVAGLTDGGWVVTWQSGYSVYAPYVPERHNYYTEVYDTGLDGDGGGVVLQRFDSNGTLYGDEEIVNTYTAGFQYDQDIIGLRDGGWLVTWTSDDQDGFGSGVYMQRYDANGDPVNAERRVNTSTDLYEGYSEVTQLEDGGWIVTWDRGYGGFRGEYDVYQQRYRANGDKFGGEVRVNTATAGYQGDASVASLKDGGWVVIWNSNAQDGEGYGIYLQRYDSLGNKVGDSGSISVNQTTTGDQFEAEVTALSDGGWVVTWISAGQDDKVDGEEYTGIYCRQYNAAGQAVGNEILVNTTTKGDQYSHEVTALDDGGWVVAWQSDGQESLGDPGGIYQKMFRPKNDAPTAANGTITTTEDTAHVFAVSDFNMTDVNGNALAEVIITGFSGNGTLTLNGGPVGAGQIIKAEFLPNLVWTPAANANGDNLAQLSFQVRDNGGTKFNGSDTSTATYVLSLGATAVNDAPLVANAIPDQSATEDTSFLFTFAPNSFTDAESVSLTYTASLADGSALPSWLTFDPSTRTFSGTPTNDNVGPTTVKVTASDGSLSVSDTFVINVQNTNDAPTVANPIADAQGAVGAPLNYSFSNAAFNDVDVGDTLTYSASLADGAALPAWLTFNGATRSFTGTPPDGSAGVISVKVTASDGKATASDTFDLTIVATNHLPTTTNDTAVIKEGQTAVINVLGNDVDADGDALSVATASVTSGNATVAINPDGTLSVKYTGANLNAGQTTDVVIAYQASDGMGESAGTLTVTVNGVSETPPDIRGNNRNNTLNGTAGGEHIYGLGGKDTISGKGGKDIIEGGKGNDMLTGGAGADTFLFHSKEGKDTITDFSLKGGDVIDLHLVNEITTFKDLIKNHAHDVNGGVMITIDKADSIFIEHIHEKQLTAGDFHF